MAKSLKAANQKWLWGAVALDAAICIIVAAPAFMDNPKPSHLLRGLLLPVAPVIVLLLSSVFSSDAKAKLVFWRLLHAYPGHRAFTEIGPRDSRFSMVDLQKNVGTLPTEPKEQNEAWYKLYKKVEAEVTVSEPSQHFLLLRDLAAMSVVLVPVAFIAALLAGLGAVQTAAITGFLAVQYVVAAVGAQNIGKRMVANVMALHAIKKRR